MIEFIRKLTVWFAVALCLALGSACGKRITPVEQGNRDKILLIGNGADPSDLDPQITTGLNEFNIESALFEGLVIPHPADLSPLPGVAESWEVSDDGLTYTFHLRHNARWSNGYEITAADFVFSAKRILAPALGGSYAYMLYPIRNAKAFNKGELKDFERVGVKALGSHTLEYTLNAPTPYFLTLMYHNAWFPVHHSTILKHGKFDERGTRWTRPDNFVCNGPFHLQSWKISEKVTVRKNPYYWDAANVKLNGIDFYPINNVNTEERGFRAGQLHLTGSVPPAKIQRFKDNHYPFLKNAPWLGSYYYLLNTKQPPLNDKRVRQALSLAVDRQMLVDNIRRSGELPAFHFTPPDTAGYTSRASVHENIAEARQLLAEAGFPEGKGFPQLELLYNTSEGHRKMAEAIQQMWNKNLNIQVELVNQSWKVYLDRRTNGNYAIARASWIGDYNDPNTFLDLMVSDSGNNHTGWANVRYDVFLAKPAS